MVQSILGFWWERNDDTSQVAAHAMVLLLCTRVSLEMQRINKALGCHDVRLEIRSLPAVCQTSGLFALVSDLPQVNQLVEIPILRAQKKIKSMQMFRKAVSVAR